MGGRECSKHSGSECSMPLFSSLVTRSHCRSFFARRARARSCASQPLSSTHTATPAAAPAPARAAAGRRRCRWRAGDAAWALAHSIPALLEVLQSAADAKGGAASAGRERPAATKAQAAAWLWQLVGGGGADAREEAGRAKAVETLCRLLSPAGTSPACLTSCLGCLTALAMPVGGEEDGGRALAVAACEGVMAARPPVVPWLLRQLEAGASTAPGVVAATLGLLHALVLCAETRPLVGKVMASWDCQPLVQALAAQQALPLLGGRTAAADAAGVIALLCSPPPAPASAAAAAGKPATTTSSSSKTGSSSSSKGDSRASSAARTALAGTGAAAGGGSLAAAVQQRVLSAGGLEALIQVCTAHGSTAGARSSALVALRHLLAAHGSSPASKEAFAAAGGLRALVQVMARPGLPLAAHAAAASCLHDYLAPAPSVGGSSKPAAAAGLGLLLAASSGAAGTGKPATPSSSRPGTATSAATSRSIVASALKLRREQQQDGGGDAAGGAATGGSSSSSSRPRTRDSSSGGGSTSRALLPASQILSMAAANGCSAGPLEQLPVAPGDAAAAAVAAAQAALLATWDDVARQGLADCASRVLAAGAVPALLLLCCGGPDRAPQHLLRAAGAAAAGSSNCSPVAAAAAAASHDGGLSPPENSAAPACSNASSLPPSTAGTAAGSSDGPPRVGEALNSIAEPSHAGEGDDDDDEASKAAADGAADGAAAEDGSAQVDSASDGAKPPLSRKQGGKKQKGGKKGAAKQGRDAATDEAQAMASAAVQLLALSGDGARLALVRAGALEVLLPLLEGPVSAARWHARQALLALSLVEAALLPVKLPPWLSLVKMPASHWQLLAPLSMPPQPPLPTIHAGRSRAGGADAAAGGSSGGAYRPGSTGRRASISNMTSAASAQLGGSSGGAHPSGLGGSLPAEAAGAGAGGGARSKAPRGSIAMLGAAGMQPGALAPRATSDALDVLQQPAALQGAVDTVPPPL